MLGYRKQSFARAHTLLSSLRVNADDPDTLKALQQLLYREIVRAEMKIRVLKAERRAIQMTGGHSRAKRSSYLGNRIERLRQVTYVWRCFGDAIAFLYMDKFALKQCYFSTESTQPKHNAGFLADKSGVASEIALLEAALKANVPALLTELTSTIRHGDICLMGGADPLLIEVKSSKTRNPRGKRQRRALEKLHAFFESDKAEGLRGFPDVRRVAFEMPERTHVEHLSACIVEALRNGHAVLQPEEGLFFIVLSDTKKVSIKGVLQSLNLKSPWITALNELKIERAWAPYMPFTLTIVDKDHLWKFIKGELCIVVVLEWDSLCKIAQANGCEAKLDLNDSDYPLQIKLPEFDAMTRVSGQLLARIPIEFVSSEWAVLSAIEVLKRGQELVDAGQPAKQDT